MKIVAAVFADFVETFLGGPSQLLTRLGSRSIIEHTLSRLLRVAGVDGRCLFVQPRDEAVARQTVANLGLSDAIDVLALDNGTRARRELIRCGRKWNLDCWRGSPLGTTWFDEFIEAPNVGRVLDHCDCEGVLCLDGHQPLLDAEIATAMIAQQRENDAEARFVFTQAPPGLAGILLRRDVTRELLERQIPIGILLSYRPEMPQMDPINKAVCCRVPAEVAQTPARLTGDTQRSRELLELALAELGAECSASDVCTWLAGSEHDRAGRLPLEVDLELTTDDPLPETTLRPRGSRVPRRRLDDLDAVSRLAEQLAAYDDRLLVLGGHGDPLLHPAFADVCRRVRTAGICALGVATTLVELSDPALQAMLATVDLVEVQLDADSAETYRSVHGVDAYARVLANVERIQEQRQARMNARPVVACSLTRCSRTLAEVEAFFAKWIRATGWAVIRGYNEYCGRLAANTVLGTTPPVRGPCRRLASRMTLLADGQAVLCEQDVGGEAALGSWITEGLEALWRGAKLAEVREAHSTLSLGGYPLCERCGEWHRP